MAAPLDIVHLRTVVAIAECGGFGRAAAALHLSQPTVSQHVRALEKRLDTRVLEKIGRVARFTEAGERVLTEARRILAVHDEAVGRLDAVAHPVLVVGSTETAADQVLPDLLGAVRSAFDGRRLQFHIDRSTQIEDRVARGEIDLAILLGVGDDLVGVEVGVLDLDWYAAPGFALPDGPVPLVAYVEPCGMRRRALTALDEHGRGAEVVAESTSLEGVLAAARAGLGVAVLPSGARVPAGLELRHELPLLGSASVRLIGRRGLDAAVEATARVALLDFFGTDAPIAPADEISSDIAVGRPLAGSLA